MHISLVRLQYWLPLYYYLFIKSSIRCVVTAWNTIRMPPLLVPMTQSLGYPLGAARPSNPPGPQYTLCMSWKRRLSSFLSRSCEKASFITTLTASPFKLLGTHFWNQYCFVPLTSSVFVQMMSDFRSADFSTRYFGPSYYWPRPITGVNSLLKTARSPTYPQVNWKPFNYRYFWTPQLPSFYPLASGNWIECCSYSITIALYSPSIWHVPVCTRLPFRELDTANAWRESSVTARILSYGASNH